MHFVPNNRESFDPVASGRPCVVTKCLSQPPAPPDCHVLSQDAGGARPGLVSHATEQHWLFPAPRPQPAAPAQTVPHGQPHRLRSRSG